MRFLTFLSFIASTMLIAGCESLSTPTDLPYDELLVVRGVLTAGQVIDSIQIERTLPLTAQLTGNARNHDSASFLPNATIKLSFEGREVGMRYKGNGYFTSDSIVAQPGVTYSLDASADGKHAYAHTIMPHYVIFDTLAIQIDTSAGRNPSMLISMDFHHDPYVPYTYYTTTTDSLGRPGQFTSLWGCQLDTSIKQATTSRIWSGYIFTKMDSSTIHNLLSKTTLGVITFDRAYYDYFQSSHFGFYSNGSDILFSTSAHNSNVVWNVHGDGFGMFVGRAITLVKLH